MVIHGNYYECNFFSDLVYAVHEKAVKVTFIQTKWFEYIINMNAVKVMFNLLPGGVNVSVI